VKLFYFFAQKIGYTLVIAFLSVLCILLCSIFGFYLGTSFLYSTNLFISEGIVKWLPLSILLPSFFYCIIFGLLASVKIPPLLNPLKEINKYFFGDQLSSDIEDEELIKLYGYVSGLPVYNMILVGLVIIIAGLLFSGAMYYDIVNMDRFIFKRVQIVLKIIVISSGLTLYLSAMLTYLITDILTSHERATCYNELRRRGIKEEPRVLIGIRVKFNFFVILMILALLTFAAFIEKGRYEYQVNLVAIILYFVTSVLVGFFVMYINTHSILRILRDISTVAQQIASGDEVKFNVFPLERELADIEYSIMDMSEQIRSNRMNLEQMVADRTKEVDNTLKELKEKDDQIQSQLYMAKTIQRSILPGDLSDWNELRFEVEYLAMEQIGGDFYDVFQLPDNRFGLCIADISGHGIPAALVTTMAKVSFGTACVKYSSPRRIFQEVNQNIIEQVKTQDYLTCFFIAIDEEYNVTYANASHQKGILLRTEEGIIELLDTDGLFIGAIEDARSTYEEKLTKLNYGDRIILYTDGIPESVNVSGEAYSNERFESVILKNRNLPLKDFKHYILEDVQMFIGHSKVEDDITLIIIELTKDAVVDVLKRVKGLVSGSRYFEAIELLQKGLIMYPNEKRLLYNLGKSYFRVSDYGKTVEIINKYLDIDKKNKFAYYIAGAAYYQMLDYQNAVDFFLEATSLDPNFINALYSLGMAYRKKGLKNDAKRCFEKVINIDPENNNALSQLNNLNM